MNNTYIAIKYLPIYKCLYTCIIVIEGGFFYRYLCEETKELYRPSSSEKLMPSLILPPTTQSNKAPVRAEYLFDICF